MENEIYREHNGSLIKGRLFKIFIYDQRIYHLTDIKVYADGYIDCYGEIDLDTLRNQLDKGRLVHEIPDGGTIFVPYIGYIEARASSHNNPHRNMDNHVFVKRIKDAIKELNEEDFIRISIRYFKEYLIDASEANFDKLKNAYDKITVKHEGIMEFAPKDPLIELMNTGKRLSKEEREYMLNDYFSGEWVALK